MTVYNDILSAKAAKKRLLAILIDPDKFDVNLISQFVNKISESIITHIFVGGSTVEVEVTQKLVSALKPLTKLPIVLFPGDVTQISKDADAILFLSLISGRNPKYLIEKQIEAVSILKQTNLEVIPTGYILIENGKKTAVQRVTNTLPIPTALQSLVADTAKAGELLGKKLIYLEAGSGALFPVPLDMISFVNQDLKIPLIVGGGIRTIQQLGDAYMAGADLVVIGTAFENNIDFFNELKR
ncbi:geranylgeranylglyceryl/heptaprenylglyceryl phosphate synthase [Olleya sp. HaHaR_3_96]|uniref:geranylgeranylglyceryl/heptaprenylglyceryl phosphate synthase n=1 Tax=Olleya sp. HaHaR_3_96 TaxID=2745560 RepID=UPI001C4E8A7E|nr:geranylgeranylglyceryl/heptaprenylglyceryl phosphate synthase [Olleya sp. HaHaR_3_96]QXP60935.1 geranylgeranylglyceryl/heptaprenylglyceryl phosphate synthase [Olleya sp. HaHaR_3_96]